MKTRDLQIKSCWVRLLLTAGGSDSNLLPQSLSVTASVTRPVAAREEPDGLLKIKWGKCGISPTGSICNLLTPSEPKLDGDEDVN